MKRISKPKINNFPEMGYYTIEYQVSSSLRNQETRFGMSWWFYKKYLQWGKNTLMLFEGRFENSWKDAIIVKNIKTLREAKKLCNLRNIHMELTK